MPWIVDGNNLAGGGGRAEVRGAVLALAHRERIRIVLFFDGAPPAGAPEVERLGSVQVHYVPNADDAIVRFLAGRGRGWTVATDDRGLAQRVRNTGAAAVPTGVFRTKLASGAGTGTPDGPVDVGEELAYFRDAAHRLEDEGGHVPRPRRRRKP